MEQLSENTIRVALEASSAEARRWLGSTSPNPPVGAAALNAKGDILAIAAHQRAGSDHAEAALLKICEKNNSLADIHTLIVTLEPCNHQGRTPPCTEAIIQSHIKHVVIGARDPNRDVRGGGLERLRTAGLDVREVADLSSQHLLMSFAHYTKTKRPFVTVKRALTKEGSMIPSHGQKTFSSPSSLTLAHRLRKKADAILTGSGTILADAPLFTVRHVEDHPLKRRWLGILDRRKRTPLPYIEAAKKRGLDVVLYDDIETAMVDLSAKGVRDVLVEAGESLSDAVLSSPFWTMSVTIEVGTPDKITRKFNPNEALGVDKDRFSWELFLPI